MPCVVAEYGDPVRVVCVEVCPWNAGRAISEACVSSLRCSYIDLISYAMVAISGIETFNLAKKPMKSCGFFKTSHDADTWRDDRDSSGEPNVFSA